MLSVGIIRLPTELHVTEKESRSKWWILAVVTLVMFIGWFGDLEALDFLWMIWMLATVAAGVNLVRQKA